MDGLLSIILFTSSKCGHCPEAKKELERLETDNDRLVVTIIEADSSPHARQLARTWDVLQVPHYIFVKDRNVQERIDGALSYVQLEEYVERFIQ